VEDIYLTNVDIVIIKTVCLKSSAITNFAQLSATAQIAVSVSIRFLHVVAAAAVADVIVRLCAKTDEVVTTYESLKSVIIGSKRLWLVKTSSNRYSGQAAGSGCEGY